MNPGWEKLVSILQRKLCNPDEVQATFSEIRDEEVETSFFKRFSDLSSPDSLHFFHHTLPFIQSLALRLPELFPLSSKLCLLCPSTTNQRVTLTKQQCACILACGFFGLFASGPSTFFPDGHFSKFDFLELCLSSTGPRSAKLLCLLHYFDRISEKSKSIQFTGLELHF